MTKENILYFEGAGMDFYDEEKESQLSNVGNFKIRTSFKNLDDKQIYLELSSGQELGKKYALERMFLIIDFCFYVPTNKEQEINYYELYNDRKEHPKTRKLNYTKKNIINWINKNLNCNFDDMQVLDQFYGYHVHGNDKQAYNLMENIELDHDKAEKRKSAYNKIVKSYSKIFNKKYPAINIKEMKDNYIIVDNHQGEELLKRYGLPSRYEKIMI